MCDSNMQVHFLLCIRVKILISSMTSVCPSFALQVGIKWNISMNGRKLVQGAGGGLPSFMGGQPRGV